MITADFFDINIKKTIHKKKVKTKKTIPWVDKYRPLKLNEVVYQTEVVKVLQNTLKSGELPHLLFYGQPGTGKTSSILAICRELFGPKRFSERVIELNASDERGINIVRKKIITFAKASIGTADPDYPCPPYKIIILDEADAMTREAQSALRKVMEDYSNITRFCFICNYINQIITPIISRCMPFRFKPLSDNSMKNKLIDIAEKEKLQCNEECIDVVIEISCGDMRKAITFLQNLKYISRLRKNLTVDNVYEIANCIPKKDINQIWKLCKKKTKGSDISNIVKCTLHIQKLGYPIFNVMRQINKCLLDDTKLDDIQKSNIGLELANFEKLLSEGADEYLQILNLFAFINIVSNNEL